MNTLNLVALIGCGVLALLILGFSIYFLFYVLRQQNNTKIAPETHSYRVIEVEDYEEFLTLLDNGSEDDWKICASSQFDKGWVVVYSKPRE